MKLIYYFWNFKPNELYDIPKNVIHNNLKYIANYSIIDPSIILKLLFKHKYVFTNTNINLLQLYESIPISCWVVKTDLARLLMVYFYPGLYSDVDCFIQQPLNKHNTTHNIILFTEKTNILTTELGPRECKNVDNLKIRIANYCFGSNVKQHPFLKEVIDECLIRLHQLINIEKKTIFTNEDILWVCGPDVITTIYHKSKHNYNDIYLYNNLAVSHTNKGSWRETKKTTKNRYYTFF